MRNPYDIFNLITGPARVLYAPTTVAVPKKLQEIVELLGEKDYDPKTGWVDFGAAAEGEAPSYSRGFESEGLGIEQEKSAIFNDITDVNRNISLNVAEITPENIKIVEGIELGAGTSETVAATATTAKQESVPLDAISEFPSYRIALIGERKKDSGVVVEPDGTERGRIVGVILNRCSLTGDDSEIEVAKGSLVSAPVQFEAFPEPGESKGSYGRWIFEETADLASGS